MNHPSDLKYTGADWWLRAEPDGLVVLGLTAWKSAELGEIVMAELPEAGARLEPEQEIGVLEVLKATFDLLAPFAGEVQTVNLAILDEPSLINEEPYAAGWMLRLRPDDPRALDAALSRDDYLALRQLSD